MIHHSGPVSGVAWGRGGHVATAGYDNQVILWDHGRGSALSRSLHDHLANQCRFSGCGRLLATASSDHSARIWSVADLKLLAVLNGHEDDVEMAVFDGTAERVATASRDRAVRIFDRSGVLKLRLDGHEADVISVEWSHDDRQIISSSDDGTVRRWCAETGRTLAVTDLGGVEADTVVQGDRDRLYVGTDEGEIVLLDGAGSRRFAAHRAGVKRLIYRAADGVLASAGYDRAVKLWRIVEDGSPALMHETVAPASVWLRSLAFAQDGSIIFGSFGGGYAWCDGSLSAWNTSLVRPTSAINAVLVWRGVRWTVGDAGLVSRDGTPVRALGSLCNFLVGFGDRVLTGGHLGELYDAMSGTVLHRHGSPLNCAAIARVDGRDCAVVGTYTGEALLFEQAAGELRHAGTVRLHDNAVKGLACNAELLFSVCATGAAAAHALADLAPRIVIPDAHGKISNGAAVLPDGRFVSVSRDRMLRLWAGARHTTHATPHTHSIKCVAACGRTGMISTGAYNGLVAIFDPRDGSWPTVVRPSAHGISSLAWTGVPGEFLAAAYDGQIHPVSAPAGSRVDRAA